MSCDISLYNPFPKTIPSSVDRGTMQQRRPPQPPAGRPAARRRTMPELVPPSALVPPPEDRISALPDELLGEIISLLPMKDGGRTQVLATRWRHIWRSVPLSLDCYSEDDVDSGVDISRVLQAHPGPGHRFRVMTASAVDVWLRSPALDSLQELQYGSFIMQRLPLLIFRCSNTLRPVTIANCRILDVAVFQGLHFPHLKLLGLERVRIADLSLQRLIDGCPVLEFLLVHTSPRFRRLRINSLTLTSLCVHIGGPRVSAQEPDLDSGELIVETAPCLERLIHLYTVWDLDLSVFFSPKAETLDFLTNWHSFYTGLVSCSRAIQESPAHSLTKAVHTVKSLTVDFDELSLDSVVDLMRLFPCLEKLHVKSDSSWEKNGWRRKHRGFLRCHDIRLKTVVLEPYLGNLSHINFATFFVLNARMLELMTFHIEAKFNNEDFLARQHLKLELGNKVSRGAQFHFTTACCQHAAWNTKQLRDLGLNDPFVCRC